MFPSYRHLLDLYFEQANGRQIIAHQIESFNHFMDVEIPTIIKQVNPVLIRGSPEIPLSGPRSALASATGLSTSAANALLGKELTAFSPTSASMFGGAKHEYEVSMEFENPQIRKPTIFENNGSIQPMMPNDARLRNFTYASPLCVDVRIKTTFIDNTRGGIRETKQRVFPNVHLGKIPVMVGSKYCLLHEQSHLEARVIGECAEDLGGYFIIQGGERVIISQERMSENRPFVFRNNRNPVKEVEVVEIKCISPKNEQVPKSNAVKIMYHPKNPQIHLLRVQIPRIKTEVPLFIVFRALGVLADKDIIDLIIGPGPDADNSYDDVIQESIEEAGFVITQEQALCYLGEQVAASTSKAQRHIRVEDLLGDELFPHIGKTEKAYEKACFLAHMTRKVLWISSRRIQTDDRDGYPNKRVDLPGFLLANLVRSYFSMKMIKDMKAAIAKEIHSGSWRANGNYEDILNISNIYKIVKSTILEVGLKSSLATGNFGNAKLGGPSKIGVSQVLNRLNYISGVSHLRRVSTPIEKTGKLVPPRKLNNTQWGFICPSETPEGHSVGVVKNMSSVANVSIYSNPGNIKDFLEQTGLCISLRSSTIEEKTYGMRVFLNGVWLGTVVPEKALYLVNSLRKAKRCGQIHIHTGIVWKNSLKELWLSTEAGRILRPILYAPAIREIAADSRLRDEIDSLTDWESVLLWQTPSGRNLIEYLDSGESDGAYIAMTPEKALEDPSTTHCEIHPSTILGTIASNIPFPDHNQSPRNSYQCLSVDEKVLMADGTQKCIADVEVGDEVVSFDPETHVTTNTRVCHHYVRETDKQIYKVSISGGREIIATEDHRFMTDHGPIRLDEIDISLHQMGIHIGPQSVSITVDRKIILDEEGMKLLCKNAGIHTSMLNTHIENLKGLGLLPLYSDDKRVPILARICGLSGTDGSLNVYIKTKIVAGKSYTYSLPQFQAHFGGTASAEMFEKDVRSLGMPEVSIRESLRILDGRQRHTWFVQHNGPLPTLLIGLGASFGKKTETARLPVPQWIMEGSLMTKREFLAGFQGGDGCKMAARKSGQWVNLYCEQTSQQAHPDIVDELRAYMQQIITLFLDFEILVEMREDEIVNDERIRLRFKMQNGKETLLKFWNSIGYRYDEHKIASSAIVAEFIKAYGSDRVSYDKWLDWLTRVRCLGETIFVPIVSIVPHKNVKIADITVYNDNHTFITTDMVLSMNCAMGKQAMGIYALNYRERFDAMSHVLCYPDVPLVSPFMSKFYGLQTMPSGENIVVAIMTYSGYNQEDSIMINRASLERGRFRSIFYRTYKDEEKKNQSSGEEERFDCPDPGLTRQMKHANYDKLGPDGLVPENTYVDSNDILIGKVVPLRVPTGMVLPAGTKKFRDVSRMPRNNEWGFVDKIFKNRNGEGYSFVKIRVRQDRMPEIGDKFSSRHGQKGTCGMILDPQDMPQTATGIIPDIIINPHCIPSRMTIAQLMETLLGRICCEAGAIGDGSPFNNVTLEWMADMMLNKYGLEPHSNEILYNGYTGRQMETKIFMGPCFYQRLRHCSADKMHSRASGPLVMLTRQPAEGRAREGGLRFGEMERDAVLAHGITEFTKERLMECSDGFRCWTCRECGLIAVANEKEGIWECRSCGNRTGFANVQIPYAYKLLLQELETMNITSRILTQGKFLQIKDRDGK